MKKAVIFLLLLTAALSLMGCAQENNLPPETMEAPDTVPAGETAESNEDVYARIEALLFPEGADPHYDAGSALALAEPLAQAGDAGAMYYMGKIFENQYGFYEIEQDMEKAARWFEQGAALENTACMRALAEMTMYEVGNEEAKANALHWLTMGADLGDAACMDGLGYLAGLDKNYDTAIHWYKKAVEAGGTDYLIHLGLVYEKSGDPEAAKSCYMQLLDAGDNRGMRRFGLLYREQGDYEKAVEWLEKGAAAGDTLCMLDLGHLYEHGDGVPQDKALSDYWYAQAEQTAQNRDCND